MTIAHITDYETRAPAQLTARYRKPTTMSLLASWCSELQQLEDALWALLTERGIEVAEGAQLDMLGRIVGQPREGRVDATYRLWVKARILVLRSSGQTEQLIAIAKRLVGSSVPVNMREYYPLAVTIHAEAGIDPTLGSQIAQLLAVAKGATVSLQFVWFAAALPAFAFADGTASELNSPVGFGFGALAAASNGSPVVFEGAALPPADVLIDDDGQPFVFDGDNDFLTLG